MPSGSISPGTDPGAAPAQRGTAQNRRGTDVPTAPYAKKTDEALLKRCQKGDYTAFEEVYQRYHRPILAYIYQMVQNYEDARNLTQEVFLKLFEKSESFDSKRRFSTWFYTVARHSAIDFLQSRHKRSSVNISAFEGQDGSNHILSSILASNTDIAKGVMSKEAGDYLRQALQRLPVIYREIIELVVFQDCTYSQASEILDGISEGTLRSRMFYALKLLREQLTSVGGYHGENLI